MKEGYNLFLDDVRNPSNTQYMPNYLWPLYNTQKWEVVRSYKQFVRCIIKKGIPDKVSFDHDLAEIHYDPSTWTEGFKYNEKTGLDCAKWLCKRLNGAELPQCFVHSQNPVGRKNIADYLKWYDETRLGKL